ncbi:transcription antitermination factor NusB [bacterium 210820-DFI.6.37]|nr:transcription antitermination factor NusB [bacterium 210820-DFI.6.37]
MTRTEARELLMQLLFQMEIQQDYSDKIKQQYLEEHFAGSGQTPFAKELLQAVTENLSQIDETINRYSTKRDTSRMAKVDLAIVRLALGEVLYMDQIPDPVAINEAVDMAKKYSADESRKFINGILGQIVKNKNAE